MRRAFFHSCLSFIIFTYPVFGETDKDKEPEPKKVTVEATAEIVSDFLWRGISLAGESMRRRNGESYSSLTYAPALQPTINIFSPEKNFQVQLFGNFQLTDRADRDSDKRLFQSAPGGVGPSYHGEESKYWDPYNQDTCAQNMSNQLTGAGGDISQCGSRVPGKDVNGKNEPNGMRRSDGLFVAFTYHFDPTKLGSFSGGIWFYNTFNKSPAFAMAPSAQTPNPYAAGGTGLPYSPNVYNANNSNSITRLSWHEYYIIWKFPFLKDYEPTLSFFTQYSTENGGYMAGRNYISFSVAREFRKDEFFRIHPSVNVGYAMGNNAIDNRNGIQDITSTLTFFFGNFFVRGGNVYRPDLYIWDTNNAFGYAGGDPGRANWNRTASDGLVPDPSKMYGSGNSFILNSIDSFSSGNAAADSVAKIWAREKYTLQKIPQMLFYFSFGYTHVF
ncbi:hypothetical protein [Leptospira sp. 'Mane']|uniref:hypothetical protein n=1 Tax=Leptospira sp. 'Mane' TaxID=3387407 RepID=UPI00398AE25A